MATAGTPSMKDDFVIFYDRDGTDMTIDLGSVKFHVHKLIMCKSRTMREMFSQTAGNEVSFQYSVNGFRTILDHLYSGLWPADMSPRVVKDADLVEFLLAADFFWVPAAIDEASTLLRQRLPVLNEASFAPLCFELYTRAGVAALEPFREQAARIVGAKQASPTALALALALMQRPLEFDVLPEVFFNLVAKAFPGVNGTELESFATQLPEKCLNKLIAVCGHSVSLGDLQQVIRRTVAVRPDAVHLWTDVDSSRLPAETLRDVVMNPKIPAEIRLAIVPGMFNRLCALEKFYAKYCPLSKWQTALETNEAAVAQCVPGITYVSAQLELTERAMRDYAAVESAMAERVEKLIAKLRTFATRRVFEKIPVVGFQKVSIGRDVAMAQIQLQPGRLYAMRISAGSQGYHKSAVQEQERWQVPAAKAVKKREQQAQSSLYSPSSGWHFQVGGHIVVTFDTSTMTYEKFWWREDWRLDRQQGKFTDCNFQVQIEWNEVSDGRCFAEFVDPTWEPLLQYRIG